MSMGLAVCPYQCFSRLPQNPLLCVWSLNTAFPYAARCNIKEPDEAGRAMADIPQLHFGALPGNGSLSGYLCSSACKFCHFIRGNNVCAPSGFVPGHSGTGRRFRLLSAQDSGASSFPRMKPVTDFVGCKSTSFLQTADRFLQNLFSPCFLISATNSGRLHWLTSYPKSFGLLQARSMIRMIWSGVKQTGHYRAFLSDRDCPYLIFKLFRSSISILRKGER